MAIQHGLPGSFERAHVEEALQQEANLLEVHAGSWRQQRVKEDALLKRRELVDVLDVVELHDAPLRVDWPRFRTNLSSFF